MKVLAALFFLCFACTGTAQLKRKTFSYNLEGRNNVTIHVPAGYKAERIRMGEAGSIEQYYVYPYGAVFYISNKARWNSLNHDFLKNAVPAQSNSSETFYNGIDENGFYWKEVEVDSIKAGYANVPVNLLNRFEDALQSIHIRKSKIKFQ